MSGNRVGVILVLILELASPGGFLRPWSLGGGWNSFPASGGLQCRQTKSDESYSWSPEEAKEEGNERRRDCLTSWFYRDILRPQEDSEIVSLDMSCMAKDRNQSLETQAARGSEANRARGAQIEVVVVLAGKEAICFDSQRQEKEGKVTYSLYVNLWGERRPEHSHAVCSRTVKSAKLCGEFSSSNNCLVGLAILS